MNSAVLREVSERCRGWSRFTEKNASDALALVQGFVEGVEADGVRVDGLGDRGNDSLLLLAMDMALVIWLDDCFDSARPVDIEALCRAGAGGADTEEARALAEVRVLFESAARDGAAYRWWLDTLVETLRAYHANQVFSRARKEWSLAEYLENGEHGIAVPHLVATLSLVYGFNFATRLGQPGFQRIVGHLSRTMRLRNDLASVAKERAEGDRANAVLLAEDFTSSARAVALTASLMQGYERLLARDLGGLGANDDLGRTVAVLLGVTERFYAAPRERYAAGQPAALQQNRHTPGRARPRPLRQRRLS